MAAIRVGNGIRKWMRVDTTPSGERTLTGSAKFCFHDEIATGSIKPGVAEWGTSHAALQTIGRHARNTISAFCHVLRRTVAVFLNDGYRHLLL
jgi:hypothetical protein